MASLPLIAEMEVGDPAVSMFGKIRFAQPEKGNFGTPPSEELGQSAGCPGVLCR